VKDTTSPVLVPPTALLVLNELGEKPETPLGITLTLFARTNSATNSASDFRAGASMALRRLAMSLTTAVVFALQPTGA